MRNDDMADSLMASKQRRGSETGLGGASGTDSKVSLLSDAMSAAFSFESGFDDIRSWVARAEPRKRLWGMTVAPRIPTAKHELRASWQCEKNENKGRTCV